MNDWLKVGAWSLTSCSTEAAINHPLWRFGNDAPPSGIQPVVGDDMYNFDADKYKRFAIGELRASLVACVQLALVRLVAHT